MKSEAEVAQLIMIEAGKYGITLQRNNSGAGTFTDEHTGQQSYVRFGLFNLSKQQNKKIKSSDYIAFMPFWDKPLPGGGTYRSYGVYLAIEVKKEGWVFNPKVEREVAQLAYIDWVKANHGCAGFCSSVEDFRKLIGVA